MMFATFAEVMEVYVVDVTAFPTDHQFTMNATFAMETTQRVPIAWAFPTAPTRTINATFVEVMDRRVHASTINVMCATEMERIVSIV